MTTTETDPVEILRAVMTKYPWGTRVWHAVSGKPGMAIGYSLRVTMVFLELSCDMGERLSLFQMC